MENFDQPLDQAAANAPSSGLRITPEVKEMWRQTANWALFFAVLLFILFGLIVLSAGLIGVISGGRGLIPAFFMIAIYGAIIFFPGLYYYRFSSQSKQAMNTDNTALLEEAFLNLSRFYRYVGIIIIVALSFYILALLMVGGAMMSGSGMPVQE